MKPFTYLLVVLLLSGCSTTPKAPQVAQISFISMERATVKAAEEMGDYYYNEFDVPGYKIRFESNQQIVSKFGDETFLHLDYFECNSLERYPEGHAYSARDYFPFTKSQSDMVERASNGAIIYEAQITGDSLRRKKQPICAQIWVFGNTTRKIWQPSFISNKIELKFPSGSLDDPRIPDEYISKAQEQELWDLYKKIDLHKKMDGERDVCVSEFIEDYNSRILAHCKQTGYAKNIGGGCLHFLRGSVTPTVLKHATENCD